MKVCTKYAVFQLAFIFSVIALSSFTFKPSNLVNKLDVVSNSSITVFFRGKTFTFPYNDDKVGNVYGHTWANSILLNNQKTNVSFIGLHAASDNLNLDIGAVKQGEAEGKYVYEMLSASYCFGVYMPSSPSAQQTYFSVQHYSPNSQYGLFYVLGKDPKRWRIVNESSSITVTKSDSEKLEGTFILDVELANKIEKATGTFNIYK